MSRLSGETIVFMPGLDGTAASSRPLRQLLGSDVAAHVVQYPGDRLLSFEQTVECAAAQLPGGSPAVVVAESFSGLVAIALAAAGRLNAKCLVFCASFASAPRWLLLRLGRLLPVTALMKIPIPRFLLKTLVGDVSQRPMWQSMTDVVSPQVLAHRLGLIGQIDLTYYLKDISVPCLYIQAAQDLLVPPGAAKPFVKNIDKVRIVRLSGPHFILQTQPEACLEAISDFVAQVNAGSCILSCPVEPSRVGPMIS